MRRACALAACALTAMVATSALAASSDYSGTVKGGGAVQLRIKKGHGGKKLTRFDFRHVRLKCDGKHRAATGNLSFTRPVDHGAFKIRGANSKGGVIRVNGELKDKGRKATGTIRLDGAIHVDGIKGYAKNCHSGVKHWKAARA